MVFTTKIDDDTYKLTKAMNSMSAGSEQPHHPTYIYIYMCVCVCVYVCICVCREREIQTCGERFKPVERDSNLWREIQTCGERFKPVERKSDR